MKKPEVVIVGLGYIGLPTAALIASNEIKVFAVDINEDIVNTINKGKIHIVEPDLDIAVSSSVANGLLCAGIEAVEANNYIIVVPTPFKGNKEPDISYVKSATLGVIPFLKKGDLFIIESTCPVGTTKKMMDLIYSKRPELVDNIFIAYCPERVLPGNVMYELIYNDRVIGGVNDLSTEKAINFYQKFVKGKLHATNDKTAEMCKLVENSSRDVQIAFANELSLICDKAEIDVWKLIDLANKHPRVNILQPGCGVGGHCIAVDPYFIASDFPNESIIISKSREINNFKPKWCVEKIENEVLKFELRTGSKPKIAIMGLAFKPNIDDLRQSPALSIAFDLSKKIDVKDVFFVEPNIDSHDYFKLVDFKIAVNNSDIIVFLVAHDQFKNLNLSDKIEIDFCGVLKNKID